MSSYADLDFVVPSGITGAHRIAKTCVYVNNKDEGDSIVLHLSRLVLDCYKEAQDQGIETIGLQQEIIRSYHASHDMEYRSLAMMHFKAGNIRVLVCTEAAGLVCTYPLASTSTKYY